jgi:hypothetical protein
VDILDLSFEELIPGGDDPHDGWRSGRIDQDQPWGVSWLGPSFPALSRFAVFLFRHGLQAPVGIDSKAFSA